MTHTMLIDTSHPEETRVVVSNQNVVQEYDVATSTKDQIKGNIYLAKVTRVEPSLQAVFVDYGAERQGFLPFSELHPDYYQIPVADKEALLAEVREESKAEAAQEEAEDEAKLEGTEAATGSDEAIAADDAGDESTEAATIDGDEETPPPAEDVEVIDSEEDAEGQRKPKRFSFHKRYKVNEVVKKGQILLIQVVKEERGNKGAALTTYLSLAGRYCVLMPNSTSGGGVSRKVTKGEDRKRLKEIVRSLETPDHMSLIVRTAGADRSKAEIKRDYEYLMRVWNDIRELTIQSTAPASVYEESDIIKRALRDLYKPDIEQVIVEGDEGYKQAKSFMKMMMPSHAARVKQYKGDIPLFYEQDVEDQLLSMHDPVVPLPSGGYLVINPTEALVSVDVNSGRATKERNVEETALKTNIEAARELARTLRLRDLAGLLVIDFIDMYDFRNRRTVERALKDALRHDRAKIQVGRISSFGLLEMSRQRLRPSLTEMNMMECPSCTGTGIVRAVPSFALQIQRALEKEAYDCEPESTISITTQPDVAFFLLNQKRNELLALESKYNITIEVTGDHTLQAQAYQLTKVEKGGNRITIDERGDVIAGKSNTRKKRKNVFAAAGDSSDNGGKRKRSRRRGGRRRRGGERENQDENGFGEDSESETTEDRDTANDSNRPDSNRHEEESDSGEKPKRPRRRGGRGRRKSEPSDNAEHTGDEIKASETGDATEATSADADTPTDDSKTEGSKGSRSRFPRRRGRRKSDASEDTANTEGSVASAPKEDAGTEKTGDEEAPKRPRRTRSKAKEESADAPKANAKSTAEAKSETNFEPGSEPKAEKPKKATKPAAQKDESGDAKVTPIKKAAANNDAPKAEAAPAKEERKGPKRSGWWLRK